jgi:hypothetical protein
MDYNSALITASSAKPNEQKDFKKKKVTMIFGRTKEPT